MVAASVGQVVFSLGPEAEQKFRANLGLLQGQVLQMSQDDNACCCAGVAIGLAVDLNATILRFFAQRVHSNYVCSFSCGVWCCLRQSP